MEPEHGARSSSNGADLATPQQGGLAQTRSPRSPIAEAAAVDAARINGGQGGSPPNAEAMADDPGSCRSNVGEEAWQPSWPTLDIGTATPPEREQEALRGGSPGPPSAAAPLAEPASTAAVQSIGGQQPPHPHTSAAAANLSNKPSVGGIASGFAAQVAARSGGDAVPDPGGITGVRQLAGSGDTAGDDAGAIDDDDAEDVPNASRSLSRGSVSPNDDGVAATETHEMPADTDVVALHV